MKTSETLTDSHSHANSHRESLATECRVMTEVDEDVKSLTAAIRLGGSETREERRAGGENNKREFEMRAAGEAE